MVKFTAHTLLIRCDLESLLVQIQTPYLSPLTSCIISLHTQMQQWITAGYFSGESVVMMREVSSSMPSGRVAGTPPTESTQKVKNASGLMADLEDDDDDNDKKAVVQTSGSEETNDNFGTGQHRVVHGEWFPSDAIDFSKREIK